MKNIDRYNFKDKKALIRVDFNIPLNEEYKIINDLRIKTTLPTIYKVLLDGGSVILLSHLGRPEGKYNKNFSLKHLVNFLEKAIEKKIIFSANCIGPEAIKKSSNLLPGEILLLENVRFHKEELLENENFAKELSQLADVYINDAFGASHRAHTSLTTITKFFQDKMMGYVMSEEIKSIDKILKNPKKPFSAILGGAKISDKIEFIEKLLNKIDNLLVGGAMSNLFIKALGGSIGNSFYENQKLSEALKILEIAKKHNVKVHLPSDTYIVERIHNDAEKYISSSNKIPNGWYCVDIGPQTQQIYGEILKMSKSILWNGPLGIYEIPSFREGTENIAHSMVQATKKGAFSLIGGGDSASAMYLLNLDQKISYISTGGGALLFLISKGYLPALEALKN